MAGQMPRMVHATEAATLLLRETNHRCANDLQLVVSLLTLQARRASHAETRQALVDAAHRVSVLCHARTAMLRDPHAPLETALRQTCEALQAQAEPRSILVSLSIDDCPTQLTPVQVHCISLAVNELATNAIKHAFEEAKGGKIQVKIEADREIIVVSVDDDGLPFKAPDDGPSSGLGLGLIDRLVTSVGGSFVRPVKDAKLFRLVVPVVAH
jgi:two-component sensor histidine kinase